MNKHQQAGTVTASAECKYNATEYSGSVLEVSGTLCLGA